MKNVLKIRMSHCATAIWQEDKGHCLSAKLKGCACGNSWDKYLVNISAALRTGHMAVKAKGLALWRIELPNFQTINPLNRTAADGINC